jgi:hypothetical protein
MQIEEWARDRAAILGAFALLLAAAGVLILISLLRG